MISLIDSITTDQLKTVVQDENQQWTAFDLIRHICNSEKGVYHQTKGAIAGEVVIKSDFDLSRFNNRSTEKLQSQTMQESIANYTPYREKLMKLLENAKIEDFEKTGRHASMKILSVEEFFKTIVDHQNHHTNQIRKKLEI